MQCCWEFAPVYFHSACSIHISVTFFTVRYPLLKGDADIVKLLKLLRPKVLVPLLNADTLAESGSLTPLMSVRGSSAAAVLRQRLAAAGLETTKLEFPAPPGEALALAL